MNVKHWLWQVIIWLDQGLNLLATPFHSGAWADETMSSRVYRMEQKGRLWGRVLRPLIDGIFFFDTEHCKNSHASESVRRHLPPELRN